MHFKVLACDVLTREVCWCAARCPHTLSLEFSPKGEHNVPARLQQRLQACIDVPPPEETPYDAILLAYGLCGNAVRGLKAPESCPLVIPRAHDCTTLFLGSRAAYEEHFGANPSQMWTAIGYSERGSSMLSDSDMRLFFPEGISLAELIEKYGEENAQYLMDTLMKVPDYPDIPFLEITETHIPEIADSIRAHVEGLGKALRPIQGNIRLLQGLFAGNWSEEEYLIVPPGSLIEGVYDSCEVMRAVADEKKEHPEAS